MRPVFLVIIQLVMSLAVVGLLLPAVIASVAAARDPKIGVSLAVAITIAVFVVLRIAWPQPRNR